MTGAVNIWDWTKVATNSVDLIDEIWMTEYCPFAWEPCWELCGQISNRSNAYMYRSASTIGYQQIEFTYSIDPTYVNSAGQYCEIYYTLDAVIDKNEWKLINKSTTPERIQNAVYAFDANADNNEAVTIFLFSNTGSDTHCCRIRDWKLTGIPLPTQNRTKQVYPSTTFTYEQPISSTSTMELLSSTPSSSQSTLC